MAESPYNEESLLYSNIFIDPTELEDLKEEEKEIFIREYSKKLKEQEIKKRKENIEKLKKEKENRNPYDLLPKKKLIEKREVVIIDSKYRDIKKYPLPNQFEYQFEKSYTNVKSIRLISSCFPNTTSVIKDTPIELRNNRIYWSNEEDYGQGEWNIVTVNSGGPNIANITLGANYLEVGDEITIVNTTCTPKIDGKWEVYQVLSGSTISIQIPFDITVIGGGGKIKTPKMPVYSVSLRPGSYTLNSIQTEIVSKMNYVKRQYGLGDYHEFSVNLDPDTDIVTFALLKNTYLGNNALSLTENSNIVNVFHQSHGFNTGQIVTLTGIKDSGGISSSILNGTFTITVIDSDNYQYEVNQRATQTLTSTGGNSIYSGTYSNFKFLWFDNTGTIEDNLGFFNQNSCIKINTTDPLSTVVYNITNITTDLNLNTTTFEIGAHMIDVGYRVRISGLESNPDLYNNFHTVVSRTSTEITINTSLSFLNPEQNNPQVFTELINVNLENHGFNQITDIQNIGPNMLEITTQINHNFVVGQKVYINYTNSVPPINGYYTIPSGGISGFKKFYIPFTGGITSSGNLGFLGSSNIIDLYDVQSNNISGTLGGIEVGVYINNKKHIVEHVLDFDNFYIRVEDIAKFYEQGGGSNVKISSYRHGYNGIQSNAFEESLVKPINLEDVNYVFLCSPEIGGTLKNNTNIQDAFACILLSEPAGNMIFNSHIENARIYYEAPLNILNKINLIVKRPDSFLYDFNNIDYTISLEIIEMIEIMENMYVNSQSSPDYTINTEVQKYQFATKIDNSKK
jgi:hypothetical protein